MPIKPVDYQVMIPRTMEVSKVSNDAAQRNLSAQQQAASATQQKADHDLKQVYSRSKPEEARIKEKQKENGREGKKEEKKKKKNLTGENKNLISGTQTSTIDIKI